MRGPMQPPWHVAHVIGSLRVGGAERQLVNYLLAADKSAFRHTVLCLTKPGDLVSVVRSAGVEVVTLPLRARSLPWGLRRFAHWLEAHEVAVVHTHMFYAALYGRLAGLWARVPALVTTEHGKELWKKGWQVQIDRALSKRTCRHIAVSRDGMRIRMERECVPAARIVCIPNGVSIPPDPDNAAGQALIRKELGLRQDQPVIGTVGRVVEAKGYPYLLEAFGLLRRDIPNLHWILVGDGPELAPLLERARAQGLEAAISSTGMRSDVADLLAAMDVFVMSSIREGLPIALLEAMAARRAIVVTDAGGMPEAIQDGRSGLVVPVGGAEALATAVRHLLTDPRLAHELAARAYDQARDRYGIAAVARSIEDIYLQCLAARGLGTEAASR